MTVPALYRSKFLSAMPKPSRFIGDERNSFSQPRRDGGFCLCFPEPYELGMSHLGHRLIYGLMAQSGKIPVDRAYMPPLEGENWLKTNNLKLSSHKWGIPLKQFSILGFTLPWELSLTNVLAMLKMADIPLRAKDRGPDHPIIIAGGPVTYNPAPLLEIFDAIFIGEAEEIIEDLIAAGNIGDRFKRLEKLSEVQGFLIWNSDDPVKRVIVEDFESAPFITAQLVPYCGIVHNRGILEIQRGCPNFCKFCQAGYTYKPVRQRSVDTLLKQGEKLISETGYNELSLTSLSTADYPHLQQLVSGFMENFGKDKVGLSLPSLRVGQSTLPIYDILGQVKKIGLTFALEGATERMRQNIGKGIDISDFYANMEAVFKKGWDRIKLYFMCGLPGEEDQDLLAIVDFCRQIHELYEKIWAGKRKRPLSINCSVSAFIPKPFTPFQREAQSGITRIDDIRKMIMSVHSKLPPRIRNNTVFSFSDAQSAVLEGHISRGDINMGQVILSAFEKGASRDGWREHFNWGAWIGAFSEQGMDPKDGAPEPGGALPWKMVEF